MTLRLGRVTISSSAPQGGSRRPRLVGEQDRRFALHNAWSARPAARARSGDSRNTTSHPTPQPLEKRAASRRRRPARSAPTDAWEQREPEHNFGRVTGSAISSLLTRRRCNGGHVDAAGRGTSTGQSAREEPSTGKERCRPASPQRGRRAHHRSVHAAQRDATMAKPVPAVRVHDAHRPRSRRPSRSP